MLMEVSPICYYNLHSNLSLLFKVTSFIHINSTAMGLNVHLMRHEVLGFCRGFNAELLGSRQLTSSTLQDLVN